MDVVKINSVRFFATYSRIIKFSTALELQNADISSLVKILDTVKAVYVVQGFNVTAAASDNTFAPMREDPNFILLNININIIIIINLTFEAEHERFVNRFNRTLKERYWMCFSTLPFKSIPQYMVMELIYLQILWLNFYISTDYISDILGPRSFIYGRTYYYNLLCGKGSQFGEHV